MLSRSISLSLPDPGNRSLFRGGWPLCRRRMKAADDLNFCCEAVHPLSRALRFERPWGSAWVVK